MNVASESRGSKIGIDSHPFFNKKLTFVTMRDALGRLRLGAFTACTCNHNK